MTNKQLLKEIHRDNEAINRSLQHLINIGLIGLLGRSAEEAKKTNDSVRKTLAKMGLVLVAVTEIILFVSECIEYRRKIEEKLEEEYFGKKQKCVMERIALK